MAGSPFSTTTSAVHSRLDFSSVRRLEERCRISSERGQNIPPRHGSPHQFEFLGSVVLGLKSHVIAEEDDSVLREIRLQLVDRGLPRHRRWAGKWARIDLPADQRELTVGYAGWQGEG